MFIHPSLRSRLLWMRVQIKKNLKIFCLAGRHVEGGDISTAWSHTTQQCVVCTNYTLRVNSLCVPTNMTALCSWWLLVPSSLPEKHCVLVTFPVPPHSPFTLGLFHAGGLCAGAGVGCCGCDCCGWCCGWCGFRKLHSCIWYKQTIRISTVTIVYCTILYLSKYYYWYITVRGRF